MLGLPTNRPSIAIALALAAVLAASGLARAADAVPPVITMPLTQSDVDSWQQVSQTMDGCVAGLALRSDPVLCRALSTWLTAYAGRVALLDARQRAASPARLPQPAPQPAEPPNFLSHGDAPAPVPGGGPAPVGGDHPGD
jgi:hypothetical protein